VTIPASSISAKLSFENHPNGPSRIDFTAQENQLSIVIVNADVPPNSPMSEITTSFVETVGQTPQRRDLVMALYIHSRGQAKTRQITYTFSA
jgi:hypothetical protein